MRVSLLAIVVAVVALAAARVEAAPTAVCAPRLATPAYAASIEHAAASGRDLWCARLLALKGGPTYAAARHMLTPLSRALQWHASPLTASGSYYLPFSFDFTPNGARVFALHVADGSQIVTRRVGGPTLSLY